MATADEYAQWIVSNADKKGTKEFDIVAQAYQLSKSQAQVQPTAEDRANAHPLARFGKGALDPFIGSAQLLAKGVEAAAPDGSSIDALSRKISGGIAGYNQKMEQAKERTNVGTDFAGIAGNVLSPANLLLAARAPQAATLGGKALQGLGLGAAAGAMQPTEDEGFWANKAVQTGLGGAAGGLASTALAGIGNKLGKAFKPVPEVELLTRAAAETDDAVNKALGDLNIDRATLPTGYLDAVKSRVFEGFKKGEKIDAGALMRGTDFETLGIKPLQGQLTRDPRQFTTEKNLRGAIPEIGMHLQGQEQKLRAAMQNLAGDPVSNYQAGTKSIETLNAFDQGLRKRIGDLYGQARNSTGKDLNIPMQGLAQDYARIQNDFREAIPSGVAKKFESYGLLTGQQAKPFTIEESDHLLKLINAHTGPSNPPATNAALGALRDAVKKSVTNSAPDGGVYAPAVKEAAKRFKLMEQTPALDAVYTNSTNADDFIKKFVLNGKTDQVKSLANILRSTDEVSFHQARAQIGEHLQRAMLGENVVGDAGTSGNSLAKALRVFGDEKLSAFYSPQEIETLHRLSRVSGYINTLPAGNVVNTSNTMSSALMEAPAVRGLLSNLTDGAIGRTAGGILKTGAGAVKNNMAAAQAMNPKIPVTQLDLTPEQKRLAGLLLSFPSVYAGAGTASQVKK